MYEALGRSRLRKSDRNSHEKNDLRGAQDRAPRGGKHAVCVGAAHDHECGSRVEE